MRWHFLATKRGKTTTPIAPFLLALFYFLMDTPLRTGDDVFVLFLMTYYYSYYSIPFFVAASV
jgi:hypothetical protein